jgi:hypothetical protein
MSLCKLQINVQMSNYMFKLTFSIFQGSAILKDVLMSRRITAGLYLKNTYQNAETILQVNNVVCRFY